MIYPDSCRSRTGAIGAACLLCLIFVASCNLQQAPKTPQERYQMTDAEAAAWNRLHIEEAESAATALWGHIGRGEYDQAMLLVDRYGDKPRSSRTGSRMSGRPL